MMENNPQPQNASNQQQVQVKVTDEVLKGTYANMVQIGHTQEEFVLGFMNVFPPQGMITARVFINPSHMKRIAAVMQDNLKRYEEQYGKINGSAAPEHSYGFRTE